MSGVIFLNRQETTLYKINHKRLLVSMNTCICTQSVDTGLRWKTRQSPFLDNKVIVNTTESLYYPHINFFRTESSKTIRLDLR